MQGKSAEFHLFKSAEMSDGQATNYHVSYIVQATSEGEKCFPFIKVFICITFT